MAAEASQVNERDAATAQVIDELKALYKEKLLPMEQASKFDYFHTPFMTDAEFDSRPSVLLVGQYSTGKTSFIRYLLGTDFPGQRIGPEPTTDRFVAVVHGDDEHIVPGNALCVAPDLPFRGLEKFGMSFLNKFEGSQLPNKVLENITLVDTPGILSGSKQRDDRGYDFVQVCRWFAERCDMILLLFDAHKLDISDEFRTVIESFKGHDDKIRCVLNKADQIDRQRLMRVYGALMWAMGKVLKTPEVLRVYIGSFWDQPLLYEDLANLFEKEENDLMSDLRDLPRNSAVRKINELVKRARLAKVNAHLISYLKSQMPSFSGHAKKQKELIADLAKVFRTVHKTQNLPIGDFPTDLQAFGAKLTELNFTKFNKIKQKHLDQTEQLLSVDIPRLMEQLPRQLYDRSNEMPVNDVAAKMASIATTPPPPPLSSTTSYSRENGGAAAEEEESLPDVPVEPPKPKAANPFAKKAEKAANPFAKKTALVWPPGEKKAEYDALFATFNPNAEGKLDGEQAVEALQSTDLDQDNLFKVVRGRTRRQLPSLPPNANAPRQPNFLRMTDQRSGSWRRTAVMVC
mmetsp:Transcript_96329/g.274498  ORF Transcript_96329/g.274498 Transcript_96329/m.274498 type:complete len:573 (+) Transcript_96329:392-2110(+)